MSRQRLEHVFIFDADPEHGEVVRNIDLPVAFNIRERDRRNLWVLPVVQAKVPMPVAIEREQALERVADVLLGLLPIERGERREVRTDAGDLGVSVLR